MNTNDGLKVTTADKLEVGNIIPSKVGTAMFRVIEVTPYTDPMIGAAIFVQVETANNMLIDYTFRPWDKLTVKP